MKCYYHHDRDAVALCYWCNRGLCTGCAAEVGDRLACRGRCEAEVERAVRVGRASTLMVEGSERAQCLNRLAGFGLTAFVLVVGLIISVWGYSRLSESPAVLLLGGVLVLFGLVLGVVSSRWPGRASVADQPPGAA